jgi:GTP-binding protein HflX
MLADRVQRMDLTLPVDRADLLALLHKNAQVLTTDYTEHGVHIQAILPANMRSKYAGYETAETVAV